MKIAILHTDFRLYWPARLNALSIALKSRGDNLDIIEIAGKGSPYAFAQSENNSNLNWHILFPDSKPEDLSGKKIEKFLYDYLDKTRPDVIIAGAIAFPSGALAVNWGQKRNIPVVVFDDSKIESVVRGSLTNYIKHSIYNGVDAMLYPAPDWIPTGNFWGFKKNEMFFGVDVVDNKFWSTSTEFNNLWGEYFVTVGRQIPKKNFISILQAYKKYLKELGTDQAYNIVLIGEGPERNNIKQYIADNQLSNKVFLLPFLSQPQLRGVYHNAKALCCCSDNTETWGLVINEAMNGGCPIFASYECGASNALVDDGVNGYKFHFNDIETLAKYMTEFHRLRPQVQLAMRLASKKIISNWGLEKFVKGCLESIDYVTTHPKRKINILDKIIINQWKGQYRPI